MQPKLAFFLGAGFSKNADLPIMSEFASYSDNQLQSMKLKHGPNSNSPRNAAPLLIKSGELYELFRQYLNNAPPFKLSSFSSDNMEDLFTMAEMMLNCNFQEVNLNGENRSLSEILLAIRLWLWKIYQRIPIHNPSRYNISVGPYNKFIERLYQYGLHNISIITTNYDMIIEYLFHQHGVKVCYPISEKNFEFDDLCGPNIRIASGLSSYGTNMPTLCKLHGSINFFSARASNDKKLRIVADTAQSPVGRSTISENAPSIMAVDAIHELTENRDLVPEIIPPSYAKLRDNDWLREIWEYAVKALINAQKWIFIGYSFPSTDGFMRSLINLSLMSRTGAFPEITIIDPDISGSVEHNYNQVFGAKTFSFFKTSFINFIESGELNNVIK